LKKGFLLLVALLIPIGSGASQTADRIQAAYKELKDVRGSFTQKSFIRDLGREETYKGVFKIKFPSKMRYTYRAGSRDEIIISGGSITIFQQKEKQALRSGFDRSTYGAAPVALLAGLGDINKDFEAEEKDGKLILRPKGPMGGITFIEVLASEEDFPIKGLRIHDRLSNEIRITLSHVKINGGMKDSDFSFTPPEGVRVFEQPR
jgi:outer membrane lipoprotein carrier protein